jgi:glutaredoxin-like protein
VTFRTRRGSEWVEIDSTSLFAGRNVVLFSLPGAFTPTCSSSHLPRYDELAALFRSHGVDEIICLSVNDAFVMNEWAKQQDVSNVTLLPDGSGHFTRGMGMLVDRDDLGFGPRSWRYSMFVRDGIIEKMFIEPQQPGDPFEVSDADTMLDYLAPGAARPPEVALLTRSGCPHCERAKAALRAHGLDYDELVLNRDYPHRALRAISAGDTYPQVFIGGVRIGGADQLESWLAGRQAA